MDKNKFYGLCIQGDVRKAIDYLKTFKEDKEALELYEKFKARFIDRKKEKVNSGDEWIDSYVGSFFEYFQKVLMGEDENEAEKVLNKQINNLLGNEQPLKMEEAEKEIEKLVLEKGYQFLGGKNMQFWGPYLWRETKKKVFDVELPTGKQELAVFFMYDFYLHSWVEYATHGRYYAGGWAKDRDIYYVVTEKHDEDSEDFKIWFLKHEAQHIYDYKHHPEYNGYQLEYRAKLIELIYHSKTENYMNSFSMHAKDDEKVPHAYASWLIMKNLTERLNIRNTVDWWKDIDYDKIKQAGRELFEESEEFIENLKLEK